jgi:hypothetical protein
MNLFPVNVTTPDGKLHTECRLVSDARSTTVWVWDRQRRAPVIVAETAAAPTRSGPKLWNLVTKAGMVTVDENAGCGCGAPLKRLTPQRTPGAHRLYTTPEVTDAS